HNPPSYNGFKVKGHYGGPALPSMISEIERLIPDSSTKTESLDAYIASGMVEIVDLEQMYLDHVEASFDIDAIKNSGIRLAYDAMYGAGFPVFKRLFPEALLLHCEHNPGFNGQAPEPIMKNLTEFSQLIKDEGNVGAGLATDGDADRIGLLDVDGNFVDSHHIILMLIMYLHEHKGYTGKVATSFSCSGKIAKLCQHYGIEHIVTKIGFKYIAEYMLEDDILVGGEESGGIAVKGHIPERDGIWMALVIWEFMAKTGKTLNDLKQDVYNIVGPFAFDRYDLHITEELKQSIIAKCKNDEFTSFGNYQVQARETVDGFKFILDENSWLMIRPSGTEPVLRTYAEAPTYADCIKILEACKATIL
ncbi:MAG: phosphoglucomutase/phosphomannomutase family protein, partial [Bacteroidetes bacterium]|nr:phosphoglucomutase/phosphomannomutase family protein [Bacteroidota bacterium]